MKFFLFLIITGLVAIFLINNTHNCVKNNGVAFVELARETPFDAKTLGEVEYRNSQRVKKFFVSCN